MDKPRERKKSFDELEGQDHPLTPDEKVDAGSEESMAASDPVAATAPGGKGDPVPSSGYPEALRREEEERQKGRPGGTS